MALCSDWHCDRAVIHGYVPTDFIIEHRCTSRMQLEREIQEGQFRRGHSAFVQVLAVKPSLEQ